MTTSESKGRFFSQNESIRIDSRNESIRIDSNRELECSTRCDSIHCRCSVGLWPLTCDAALSSLCTLCASHDIARSALIIGVRRDKRLVAECV